MRETKIILAAALFMIAAASVAFAFSFSDMFSFFGVSAQGSGTLPHHTVYPVAPANNSYTSQGNNTANK